MFATFPAAPPRFATDFSKKIIASEDNENKGSARKVMFEPWDPTGSCVRGGGKKT